MVTCGPARDRDFGNTALVARMVAHPMVAMMKQIDLEPEAYRETGKARLIRSILHKPVFMTISTILALWTVSPLFATGGGAFEPPLWLAALSALGLPLSVAFGVFVVLNDADRVVPAQSSRPASSRLGQSDHPGYPHNPAVEHMLEADQAKPVPTSRQVSGK